MGTAVSQVASTGTQGPKTVKQVPTLRSWPVLYGGHFIGPHGSSAFCELVSMGPLSLYYLQKAQTAIKL